MSTTDPNSLVWLAFIIIILMFWVVYFVPAAIAFARGHVHRWWILLLNVFGGSVIIGWVIALLWSLGKIGPNK